MKYIFSTCFIFLFVLLTGYTRGYSRSNGTYVQPHYRSSPNYSVRDNYSYKGNYNPYRGSTGSNYYRSSPSSFYYRGY